jgi:hypothetical protein
LASAIAALAPGGFSGWDPLSIMAHLRHPNTR